MNDYKSTDLYLSAVLLAKGYVLTGMAEFENGRKTFIFGYKETDDPAKLISDYYNRTLLIDARTLIDAIKELKARIYAK